MVRKVLKQNFRKSAVNNQFYLQTQQLFTYLLNAKINSRKSHGKGYTQTMDFQYSRARNCFPKLNDGDINSIVQYTTFQAMNIYNSHVRFGDQTHGCQKINKIRYQRLKHTFYLNLTYNFSGMTTENWNTKFIGRQIKNLSI